jgi:hypothetical protein
VTSAVAFGFVVDRKLTVDDHCDAGVCDPIGDSAAASGRTLVTVSLVSLAAGGVAAAAGLYLLWSAPSDGSSSTARAGLLVDRNLLGAQLVGAF